MSDQYGLGAIRSPEDERDYRAAELYAALGIEPVAAFPPTLTTADLPPVLNQGNTPRCVAYSISALKAWQDRHDGRGFVDLDEPIFFRVIRGTANGAYVRDGMAELVANGYPEAGGANAAAHKVRAYYAIPPTGLGLRAAISALGPVVIATPWYASWFRPVGWILPAPDVRVGGHAILATGWTPDGLRLRNSWGPRWGQGGECTMPWRYVANLWEAWKAVDVPPPVVTHRVRIAQGATIRVYRLDAGGGIRDWLDETWTGAASSAPCDPPASRSYRGSPVTTVKVRRGRFAGRVIAARTPGVTVTSSS